MTQLDGIIPRTQRECALVASLMRSEWGWSEDVHRRVMSVQRLRAWLEKRCQP